MDGVEATNEQLPRETLLTDHDVQRERQIAKQVAAWAKLSCLKIGKDDPTKQKPRIDRALHDGDRLLAFFEVKTSKYKFAECSVFVVSAKKIEAGRRLHEICRVPVFLAVEFACGTIGLLNVNKPYSPWENWGRTDRGQGQADLELGAKFDWGHFKKL